MEGDTSMKYQNGKMSDVQIAYIGGGSRGWAWTFMTDLALEPDMSGTIRLYDIDKKAAEANKIIGKRRCCRKMGVRSVRQYSDGAGRRGFCRSFDLAGNI